MLHYLTPTARWVVTYAVLGLGGNSILTLARVLDGDPLLAVYRLARDQVGRRKEILLSTTSDKHTLVTMGLDDNLLAAFCSPGATTPAAATTPTGTREKC